jgi:segregation and condensation protein B
MTPLARQLRRVASGSRPLGPSLPGLTRTRRWPVGVASTKPAAALDDRQRLARVEAVLLLAKEALGLRRIAQLANLVDATEARTLLEQLSRRYSHRGRSFQIENVAGGYRLLTRPQFAPWLVKIGEFCDLDATRFKLTPPALDTLTVVAYRQPVLRAEVEAIRGVGCGELLRQLIDRDLLRIVGRSEELGRPLEYGTTKRFLQLFGLKSLKDLPPVDGLGEALHDQLETDTNRQQNVVPRAA